MKGYTDLEQSKELAKILPLESADMEYLALKENGALIGAIPFVKDDSEVEDSAYSHIYDRIACWSFAALISVLPKIDNYRLEIRHIDNYCCCYTEENNCGDLYWYYADNPIDACVAMIEKLHELKML